MATGNGETVEGDKQTTTAAEASKKFMSQLNNVLETEEKDVVPEHGVTAEETEVNAFPGFPEAIRGEILFLDSNNTNTAAIYLGKCTYQNDSPITKMAQVCMEIYDHKFDSIAQAGDIVLSGLERSAREQAVRCVLAKKLLLVISGSVANIFGRNAINNALPLLEIPRLVERLRETFSNTEVQTL